MSLNIIINSFSLIQSTLLSKNVDFKGQSKISIAAAVFSGFVGITLAFNGFGVWSLAIQQVCGNFVSTVLLWFFSTWRPSLVFSYTSLREMFSFGSRMLLSGLLNTIFENSYLVVIGKIFSPANLGFYTRAWSLQQLPASNLTNIVGRVTFPLLSLIQDDPLRIKKGMKKSLSTLAFLNFPLMIGFALVSKNFVLVLLSDKWLPCVPYLQLLCISGLMYPLHAINLNLLQAVGRSDLFLRLEIIKKLFVIVNIAITFRLGIEAMIYGQLFLSITTYYLNSFYTAKLIDYSLKEQLLDLLSPFCLSMMMGAVVFTLQFINISNNLLMLLLQIIVGVIIYFVLASVFRHSLFVEFIGVVFRKSKFCKV